MYFSVDTVLQLVYYVREMERREKRTMAQTLEQFLDQLENDNQPAQGFIVGARSYLCSVKGPSPMLDNNDCEYFHEIKAESAEDALAKLIAMMSEEAHSPRVIREIEPDSSIFDIIEEDE